MFKNFIIIFIIKKLNVFFIFMKYIPLNKIYKNKKYK